jgi:hypothetical protein
MRENMCPGETAVTALLPSEKAVPRAAGMTKDLIKTLKQRFSMKTVLSLLLLLAVPITHAATLPLHQSAAQIHANFAYQMEANFSGAKTTKLLHRLTPGEMIMLVKAYGAARGANTATLDESVTRYGLAADVLRYRNAKASLLRAKTTIGPRVTFVGPVPTFDMTPYEIYLDFRTASGGISITSSLAEAAIYIGTNVALAAGTGYAVGTGISNVIEAVSPSTNDAIGGTVAGMVDQLSAATSAAMEGEITAAINDLFGDISISEGGGGGRLTQDTIIWD